MWSATTWAGGYERMLQIGRVQGETGGASVWVNVREHQCNRDSSVHTLDAGSNTSPFMVEFSYRIWTKGNCVLQEAGPTLLVGGSNGPCQQFATESSTHLHPLPQNSTSMWCQFVDPNGSQEFIGIYRTFERPSGLNVLNFTNRDVLKF